MRSRMAAVSVLWAPAVGVLPTAPASNACGEQQVAGAECHAIAGMPGQFNHFERARPHHDRVAVPHAAGTVR